MTLGVTPTQSDLLRGTGFVADRVGEDSIWAVLARDGGRLFGDGLFADLFTSTGRRSVPPRIVATVMVLQRWCGMSDREAVAAFEFDARWKYACGGLAFDYPGFAHTVLVDMRARLAGSDRPRRIFEVTLNAARQAGVVSAKRETISNAVVMSRRNPMVITDAITRASPLPAGRPARQCCDPARNRRVPNG